MDAIDLHVHSTFSDGTLTPSELISRAKQFHLAAMALTDHDTIEGIPEAVQAASEQNLELVPGVELSTFWNEKEIHIVGLFIDYTDKTFKKELESLRDVRRNRNITMCEKFTQLGIPIDYSDMEKEYADAVITRAHFADDLFTVSSKDEALTALIHLGYLVTVRTIFPILLSKHLLAKHIFIKQLNNTDKILVFLYHLL